MVRDIFSRGIVLCLSVASVPVIAEPTDAYLEEQIIVATRSAAPLFEVPYSGYLVSRDDTARLAYRTLPQALRDVPGVMVQETSVGQGSPYIRGFTGFRNLMLVDGVRLNNSVFRDGPNQYWSTVDLFGIDRIEVVSGPASTLYGSDAIGGTVNTVTQDPFHARSRLFYRYGSAEHSNVARADLALKLTEQVAGAVGVTSKSFGTLSGGSEVGSQHGVGYNEYDADLKLSARFANDWRGDLVVQQVRQNNVPRTHRTSSAKSWHGTSIGSDQRRELDEERLLSYVRATNTSFTGLINTASITVSHSRLQESRDRIRSDGRREKQGFDVDTTGFSLQLGTLSALGDWSYGIESYMDKVDSFSSRNPIQGPVADDAEYKNLDFFLQNQLSLTSRGMLILGVRHTMVDLDANQVADPITGTAIAISERWDATVANANLSYQLIADRLAVYGGVSEGFRAPNLSDVTRFDSARSNEFEVPAYNLQPEQFVSYEVGAKLRYDSGYLSLAYFYTDIDGLIQRVPTGRQVDGENEITKANIGDGQIQGIEFYGEHQLGARLTVFSNITWMDGEVGTFPTSEPVLVSEPVDRLMPMMGSVGLRWQPESNRWWLEGRLQFALKADELSTRDAADTSRIPPGGTPAYEVLHLGTGFVLNERTHLRLNIDNLFDEDYRVHGSGTNMPGRNLLLSVDYQL